MAALLNYGEPQILELFKNTLPSKLYWILFPISNLRDAIDATKRVLTKEKLDKQLSGEAGMTTPFMKVEDVSYSGKKASFNAQDPIREQLENLNSVVYNMSMQKKKILSHLSPKSIRREIEDKTDKTLVIEIEVEYLIVIDRDRTLDLTIGDGHKIDDVETLIEVEIIHIRIMVEMIPEIKEDKILEVSVMITEAEAQQQEEMVTECIIAQV